MVLNFLVSQPEWFGNGAPFIQVFSLGGGKCSQHQVRSSHLLHGLHTNLSREFWFSTEFTSFFLSLLSLGL